jgi:hypothetical protein
MIGWELGSKEGLEIFMRNLSVYSWLPHGKSNPKLLNTMY